MSAPGPQPDDGSQQPGFRRLSVVIPVFNERDTVLDIVKSVEDADARGLEIEIVVVDDGSSDGTREVLGEVAHRHTVLYHPVNRGKGAALRTGFAAATGDVVLVQDADQEYDPADFPKLLQPIVDGRADVVFGSRFLGDGPHRVVYYWHYLGNKLLTTLSNMCANLNLTDMETGYKAFRREVLDGMTLVSDRFGFEPEFTIKVARAHWVVYEVGISYHGRSYAQGKKITWRDGASALWWLARFGLIERVVDRSSRRRAGH